MTTILVPVDFSVPSDNAVAYAAQLCNDMEFDELVLAANLHVTLFEQIIPSPDLIQVSTVDIQGRKKMLLQQLEALKLQVLRQLNPEILVRIVISELPFLRSVLQQVLENDPCLVIIGSNSKNTAEDSMIGRQIIELTKVLPVPVLIVPPKSVYRPIVHALVARNSPGAELSVETRAAISYLFKGFEYQFYNLNDKDTLKGIIQFADDKNVQLIIALPGRHSFLYHLTHQNLLHGMLLNSLKPVLILKDVVAGKRT